MGFEDELRQVISILPKDERQTMLFSATQTTKVEDLARISLKPGPLYINVDYRKEHSTVDGVEQGYIICEADKRFLLLFAFLQKNLKKKIIVFFSSCNSVKYYSELLNYIDLPVLSLHGKMKQQKRTNTFFEFCNSNRGALICTDVAARGLDIPAVDYIVQLDPPDDVSQNTSSQRKEDMLILMEISQETIFIGLDVPLGALGRSAVACFSFSPPRPDSWLISKKPEFQSWNLNSLQSTSSTSNLN